MYIYIYCIHICIPAHIHARARTHTHTHTHTHMMRRVGFSELGSAGQRVLLSPSIYSETALSLKRFWKPANKRLKSIIAALLLSLPTHSHSHFHFPPRASSRFFLFFPPPFLCLLLFHYHFPPSDAPGFVLYFFSWKCSVCAKHFCVQECWTWSVFFFSQTSHPTGPRW